MIKSKKIGFYTYIEKDGIGRYILEVNKHLQIDTIKSNYEILSPMQFFFEKKDYRPRGGRKNSKHWKIGFFNDFH